MSITTEEVIEALHDKHPDLQEIDKEVKADMLIAGSFMSAELLEENLKRILDEIQMDKEEAIEDLDLEEYLDRGEEDNEEDD